MANAKISELIQRTPDGTEFLEVIIPPFTSGTNRKVLLQDIINLASGAVDSVNGQIGVVVLDAGDVGADPAGSAATAEAAAVATAAAATIGIFDFPVSAAAMWPRVTGGCQFLQATEIATSLFNIQSLDFDQNTQEFCQFQVVLPRRWNNGTVTAIFYWTAASGSGDVQWGISGGAYSNDDALSVAFGSAITVDDTLITANDVHITSATAAITLAGTPADSDFLAFQVSRNPGSDTLTADAKLLHIVIRITTDAGKDS